MNLIRPPSTSDIAILIAYITWPGEHDLWPSDLNRVTWCQFCG